VGYSGWLTCRAAQYSIPFVLNQCGSVVFYYTLSHAGNRSLDEKRRV